MKYDTKLCDDDMTFQDCELAILRHAVDESEEKAKRNIIKNDEIKKIIRILEEFLIRKRLVCYGGTAINNILPKEAQFYNLDVEIPDYDFYSADALDDAIEIADLYHHEGYSEVEAKAGVHYGTFKVFVNFIPIADVTYLPQELFTTVQNEAISIAGILYAPPNFLRMNMFLELSRPAGDVSRWEKVLKRLTTLNHYYPLNVDYDCHTVDFQRKMDDLEDDPEGTLQEKIYVTVRDTFINQGVIFFGGYASSLYGKYMPTAQRQLVRRVPDFDVLSEDPERDATIVEERLHDLGIKKVVIERREAIGEIIPIHYEVRVGRDILAHIYQPIACHSYNEVKIDGRTIRVGTIDTLLTFYLAFIYADKPYYYRDRILCMTKFLFDVQQANRLAQHGILRRFSINCVGKQKTLDEIRTEKSRVFKELRGNPQSREYKMWFLKYSPGATSTQSTTKKKTTKKRKTKKRSSTDWLGF